MTLRRGRVLKNSYSCHVFPSFAAPVEASFLAFFFLPLPFLPLLSLFLSPLMPAFHTSTYLTKNPSKSSACTTVDSFIRFPTFSPDLPSVARMMRGSGCGGGVSVASVGSSGGDTRLVQFSRHAHLRRTEMLYIVFGSNRRSHGFSLGELRRGRTGGSETAS